MLVALGCGATEPIPSTGPDPTSPATIAERSLSNDEYSIIEMATAHGAFTVEIEVVAGADIDEIARGVVEPVLHQYAEVLVYFYERGGSGELPSVRVQWTAETGYTRIEYE